MACPDLAMSRTSGFKENYLGWLQDEASLVAAYSAADLFVVPSMLENFPNTVLEAMACGTPCVAFEQGGMAAADRTSDEAGTWRSLMKQMTWRGGFA